MIFYDQKKKLETPHNKGTLIVDETCAPSQIKFLQDTELLNEASSQYNSFFFRKLLDDLNVVQSFSKKGHPYDNAVVESFFKYLKLEEVDRRNYTSLQELKLSVFEYIKGYYNSKRPHSSLGMLTLTKKSKILPSGIPDGK